MHVNFRRKKKQNHDGGGSNSPRESLAKYKKLEAHKWRARQRTMMENERWDDLPTKVTKSILWDYW